MKSISEIIRISGLSPIESNVSCRTQSLKAQALMRGRTHYYDADTLRAFGASVLRLDVVQGVALVALERFEPVRGGRHLRTVVHDLTGYCVDICAGRADSFPTRAPADRDYLRVLDDVRADIEGTLSRALARQLAMREHEVAALRLAVSAIGGAL